MHTITRSKVTFPDAVAQVVQITIKPTYLGVLEGAPPDSRFRERIQRWADKVWGDGAEFHFAPGKGQKKDWGVGGPDDPTHIWPPITVLVELLSDHVFDPSDDWSIGSWAKVVFLTDGENLEDGITKLVQRFVDATELRWETVGKDYSP